MSKFGKIIEQKRERVEEKYDRDDSEFDRDSIDEILKQHELIVVAIKELRVRYKQDDYSSVISILKRIQKPAKKFEERVDYVARYGGYHFK
jgi:hypothetical protein